LYASGRLEGVVSYWWDAFTVAHANADTITWQEFLENFRAYHIPSGIMKLKKKEFLSLTQGNMSVSVSLKIVSYEYLITTSKKKVDVKIFSYFVMKSPSFVSNKISSALRPNLGNKSVIHTSGFTRNILKVS
jgi:hypothetical protein